jgi:glycerol-3-phosphate O-acyltransferase / dihydroxyacetone phosphate acyltransferase
MLPLTTTTPSPSINSPKISRFLNPPFVYSRADVKEYQSMLDKEKLKDDRVRTSKYLKPRHLYYRLAIRSLHTILLSILAVPGLLFWTPIFIVARRQARFTAKSGPTVDVYDEVAQTKLLWGLGSGIVVYLGSLIYSFMTGRGILFTGVGVPLLMWFTLRWIEDILSAARSARSIIRMLCLGKARMEELRVVREGLYERVIGVATGRLGLPRDAGELVKTKRGLRRRLGYFSVRRRRKKDWNEVLRLYDVTDYAE